MNDTTELAQRLSAQLKQARKAQGLTLDAVAKRSGVSRSMLSQIERGESSPTVATLWNLTRALGVDFAGMLDGGMPEDDGAPEVMRAERTPRIDSRGEGCQVKILSPPHLAGRYELYDIELAASGALRSDPHRAGCEEHLTVLAGKVRVSSGHHRLELSQGDTGRYRADRAHAIEAADGAARALLVVLNS